MTIFLILLFTHSKVICLKYFNQFLKYFKEFRIQKLSFFIYKQAFFRHINDVNLGILNFDIGKIIIKF